MATPPPRTPRKQGSETSEGTYLKYWRVVVLNINVDPNYNNYPYFVGQVDFFDEIAECDETNNISVFALTLGCTTCLPTTTTPMPTRMTAPARPAPTASRMATKQALIAVDSSAIPAHAPPSSPTLMTGINCASSNPSGLITFDISGSGPFCHSGAG